MQARRCGQLHRVGWANGRNPPSAREARLAAGEEVTGDTSTLEDFAVLATLKEE